MNTNTKTNNQIDLTFLDVDFESKTYKTVAGAKNAAAMVANHYHKPCYIYRVGPHNYELSENGDVSSKNNSTDSVYVAVVCPQYTQY